MNDLAGEVAIVTGASVGTDVSDDPQVAALVARTVELFGGLDCSSVAGLVGFATIPAYTASKHGVVGLTKTAALGYAEAGIRVNAVAR